MPPLPSCLRRTGRAKWPSRPQLQSFCSANLIQGDIGFTKKKSYTGYKQVKATINSSEIQDFVFLLFPLYYPSQLQLPSFPLSKACCSSKTTNVMIRAGSKAHQEDDRQALILMQKWFIHERAAQSFLMGCTKWFNWSCITHLWWHTLFSTPSICWYR